MMTNTVPCVTIVCKQVNLLSTRINFCVDPVKSVPQLYAGMLTLAELKEMADNLAATCKELSGKSYPNAWTQVAQPLLCSIGNDAVWAKRGIAWSISHAKNEKGQPCWGIFLERCKPPVVVVCNPTPAATPPFPQTQAVSEKKVFCPGCGKPGAAPYRFCSGCGTALP